MTERTKASRPLSLMTVAALAAVVLACGASRALAQDDDDGDEGPAAQPIVVQIQGPCALTVGGKSVDCQGVAYMVFPSNGRIDFTAISGDSGWAFSGEDDDNEDGQYALTLDSVLGPSAARLDAEGECDMEVAQDKRTVRSLECTASTDQGDLTLRASGVIAVNDDEGD